MNFPLVVKKTNTEDSMRHNLIQKLLCIRKTYENSIQRAFKIDSANKYSLKGLISYETTIYELSI